MDRLTKEQRKQLYFRLFLRAVIFIAAVSLLVFTVPRIFPLLAPLLFAFLIAFILNPVVSKLNAKLSISRRLPAFILVVLVFTGFAALTGWLIYTIINEAVSLATNIQSIWEHGMSALDFINERLESIINYQLPGEAEVVLNNITDSVYQWIQSVSTDFLDFVISNTAAITSKIGIGVFGIVIIIMASYYFTVEYKTIGDLTEKYLGNSMNGIFRILKDSFKSALGGYLKAQLLLALLAFIIMFPALAIYGQEYAALIALFLAFVDFLPFVGTIAVLAPWGIIEMISGNIVKGIFLVVLGGAFFVIRRFAEPKIMGSQTGLHPFAAIISIYLGMRIYGIWGAIFGPIIMMIAVSVIKAGVFDNMVKDVKDVINDISIALQRREDK